MSALLQAEHHGAFLVEGFGLAPEMNEPPLGSALAGVRLAVKDVFQVQGMRCGAGNPSWLAEQAVAIQSASVVQWLLDAGAQWVGKTVTDELTYSLAGINAHYGTPRNPAAEQRLPGGSSSGSVVAVAAGYADLALGTDCGGSIRLPASYCGVWGVRPSHGRISSLGCFTLAHSFDTVGWFAADADVLGLGLEQLLHTQLPLAPPANARLMVCDDVLGMLDQPVREAFEDWLLAAGLAVERLPAGTLALEEWAEAFRVLQAAEIWQQHGSWVRDVGAVFGADVASRFQLAATITPAQVAQATAIRTQVQPRLAALLGDDGYLLMPPVPGPAPYLDAPAEQVQDTRARSQRLLCMAGLAGLPQVVLPWTRIDGAPVGLSLLGPRFADEQVMSLARHLHLAYLSS
ncbi:amidase [Halopseudomonas pelagia]|uniref:amidase n=1 Tax=Halopseudomonas pelagia TaxID=553151 RepID=UPI0003B6313A|nr:amidase [Halopseudomonas pelagia]|tara:strand:+ start:15917 stop:17125 length:1209 start_codon:yes stop_codon:yes gene_type:complete